MKRKVAIIFTGGTIAMKINKDMQAAIPSLTGHDIISKLRYNDKSFDIEIIDFGNYPSPQITLDILMDLKDLISNVLKRKDIFGIVITHGTDTLEETAYFLDLIVDTKKPIIMTGAMRNFSELGYDGLSNILSSVYVATSEEAYGKGVLVVFNNEIFTANEVTKVSTSSLNSFKSPVFGPIGIVDGNKVMFYRNPTRHEKILTNRIEKKVSLIKTAIDMDDKFIRFSTDSGDKGIVIEGAGRGNVTPRMADGIRYSISKGVTVVLVSRCQTGQVLDCYGYKGGGKELVSIGVILGGALNGQKARIKLMVALGFTNDKEKLKEIFSSK